MGVLWQHQSDSRPVLAHHGMWQSHDPGQCPQDDLTVAGVLPSGDHTAAWIAATPDYLDCLVVPSQFHNGSSSVLLGVVRNISCNSLCCWSLLVWLLVPKYTWRWDKRPYPNWTNRSEELLINIFWSVCPVLFFDIHISSIYWDAFMLLDT